MRRRRYYTVEYHDETGQPQNGKEEDEYLADGRAHELASRWIRKWPARGAIIYLEVEKWYGQVLNRKGRPTPDGARQTRTAAQFLGRDYRGPRPLRSIMQRRGKIEEMDVPIITV